MGERRDRRRRRVRLAFAIPRAPSNRGALRDVSASSIVPGVCSVRSRRRRLLRGAAVACAIGALPAASARAAGGDLDERFGVHGVVRTTFAAYRAMVVQPNGRIVLVGSKLVGKRAVFAVSRRMANGTLDGSFSHDGKLTTRFSSRQCVEPSAVALQRDGKIVVVGRSGCANGRFAVARYRPDGRLDRSFSGDGRVTTRFGRRCRFSTARAVTVRRDGSIVAAGDAGCARAGGVAVSFAVARYTRAGRLDTTFGGDGRVTTDFTPQFDVAYGIVAEPRGTVVAAGTTREDFAVDGVAQWSFGLARYERDGSLSSTFGAAGKVMTTFDGVRACGPAEAHTIARQRDGKLVVGGDAACGHPNFALARYRTDGSLDPSFGTGGRVATIFAPRDCSEIVKDVAIQPDGGIVAAGAAGCRSPHPSFALARYDADGALDTSFGGDGLVTSTLRGTGDCFDEIEAIGLWRGRILATGFSGCARASALLRYLGR